MPHFPRLLANVIDAKAKSMASDPWLLYAPSSLWEQEGGFRTITWNQFANAINKAAFWLDENIPRESPGRETIAYLGPNDARYYILMVAVAKSKRTLFIPDGRITPSGLAKVLAEIRCTAWIATQDKPSTVEGQKCYVFPSLDDMLGGDFAPPYAYNETWEQAKDDIVCIIHTSGTTGDPSPIYLRNGYMSVWDSWKTIMSRHSPRKITYRHMENALSLTTCAPQWLAGLAFSLNAPVFLGLTTVMLPSDMIPPFDPQSIIRICQHTGANSIITPPSLIEDFYNDKEVFAFLKSLDYVCWLGAGLNHTVGDMLAQHTNLFPVIGSTERGGQLSFESDDVAMWKSYEFVPEMGSRFQQVDEDLYELHIDRTTEHQLFQCGFHTFPSLDSIDTGELYYPVKDKFGSQRWISRGRKDDLVKLSWLAKFHAAHIEDEVSRHPQVSSVIVGGEGRHVPYIIIEPKDYRDIKDPNRFLDRIYDIAIKDINKRDDDEIRIPREMIMLSDPALPFKRTMKMTVLRREVEMTYQHHIERLYQKLKDKEKSSCLECYDEEPSLW
ncbi:NRPS-like enzyme [Penicillium lagena]|uniref:NRPS-like enzyme n=1 Tax=Penicillium lagena TaxID=94218 RepID=UPI0025422324|nr:NRPS-like enzyme [Penicillium lagena]KAJ5620269.1 NRPS-like enzyme [Penicillium lagena]